MKTRTAVSDWRQALAWGASLLLVVALPLAAMAADEWPRTIQDNDLRINLFQPQFEKLDGETLSARAAVSVTGRGAAEPVFGAVWFTARTITDTDARRVRFEELDVNEIRFPKDRDVDVGRLAGVLERDLRASKLQVPLDEFLAKVEMAEKERAAADDLGVRPPRIMFAPYPAALLLFDGEPELRKIEGTDLMRVVNTPNFVVLDPSTRLFHLRIASFWYTAKNATGPWQVANAPPPRPVLDAMQADGESAEVTEDRGYAPQIIVSTQPAELISTDGDPKFRSLSGTDLLYISNTTSDVFLEIASQRYFVVLSGRWYAANALNGPWAHVPSGELPTSFAGIRTGSEKGDVLAYVAGTEQARDAVLDAQVPQTAVVRRDEAKLNVIYNGEPRFEGVEDTSIQYAVNTTYHVLRVRGHYYACHDAVWFESSSPHGPWVVCTAVPEEVQEIPPSSPVYPVKYVYVYDSTPEVVYVGYTAGYYGCYPYRGTVVWGTGYDYPCWYGGYYYPRPWTWGFGFSYVSSHWAIGIGYCDPWWWSPSCYWGGWWGYGGFACHDIKVKHKYVYKEKYVYKSKSQPATLARANVYDKRDDVAQKFRGPAERVRDNAKTARLAKLDKREDPRKEILERENQKTTRKSLKALESPKTEPTKSLDGQKVTRKLDRGSAEKASDILKSQGRESAFKPKHEKYERQENKLSKRAYVNPGTPSKAVETQTPAITRKQSKQYSQPTPRYEAPKSQSSPSRSYQKQPSKQGSYNNSPKAKSYDFGSRSYRSSGGGGGKQSGGGYGDSFSKGGRGKGRF